MEELQRQVRRARRRMGFRRFGRVLGWCWFATLVVALGLIVADRFYPLGPTAWQWAVESSGGWPAVVVPCCWIASALAVGLIAAMVWMVATQRKPLAAAVELDRRFALKERVSSTLALSDEQRQSEAGRALIDDAVGRVRRVDVAGKFSMVPGRPLLMPLVPGVLAALVAWFSVAAKTTEPAKKPEPDKVAAVTKRVKKPATELSKKLEQRRKEAEKLGLKDAQKLFEKLQQAAQEMANREIKREDALVKLNDLAREMKKHRDQMGGADRIKEQLSQLSDPQRGPAEDFAKAVQRGDFEKAAEELDKMKQKLADGELDDQQKQQLADQFKKMQEKLDEIVQQQEQKRDELQQKIDELRQNGQLAEADKLQQQLDQLSQQMPQMGQLGQMADQLQKCAQLLGDGQMEQAADALEGLQADLQQQLDEMELIEQAMQQLVDARDQMNCPQCGGQGFG